MKAGITRINDVSRYCSIIILTCVLALLAAGCGNKEKALNSYNEGKKAYYRKDWEKAEKHFRDAATRDDSLLNASLMLAKVYYYNERHDEARSMIDSILEEDSDHPGALYWNARLLVMQETKGKEEAKKLENEAIASLQKLLEINGHHVRAHTLLALLYEKHGLYKKAIYEYLSAIEEQNALINARANLGILYKRLGLKDKSIRELNTAISIAEATGRKKENLEAIKKEIEK